jgi:hypothetical protein
MVYLEISPWHQENPYLCAYGIGFTVFGFYFFSNLMYWLFGFKYWVTAVEIPALVAEHKASIESTRASGVAANLEKRFWTETKYTVVNWIGIMSNVICCVWIGWKRGELDWYSILPGGASRELGMTVLYLELAISILLLISAFFLADALRRLRNEYKADKRLDVNRNVMCLHVIALFNHTFILVVAQFFIVYSFLRPSEKSKDQLNIARIFMFGSQAISMTIVIYLFMKFALPTSSMSKKEERDVIVTRLSELRQSRNATTTRESLGVSLDYEDELEEEPTERDPKLDMLMKVTNKAPSPKFKKLDRSSNIFDYMNTQVDADGKVVFVEQM